MSNVREQEPVEPIEPAFKELAAAVHQPGIEQQPTGSLSKSIGFWLNPFTQFHRIPVFRRIGIYLVLMAAYTVFVHACSVAMPTDVLKDLGSAAYTGVILGLLLVFRTNSAYERWWEGRKLWGQLVNDSRNLCLKVRAFVPVSHAEKVRLGELVVSFAFALKHHLRDTRPVKRIPGTEGFTGQNIPVSLAGKIYELLTEWQQEGHIDGFARLQLDQHARAYMDILGSCERIRSTPLAVSYRAFLRQGIGISLFVLPWYVPQTIPIWWSMPLILISAYFLIGLELIAEEIEDPFGDDGDDLPLDQICANIQATITEILDIPKQQFTVAMKLPRIDPLKEAP